MSNAQSVPRQHIAVFGGLANPWPSDESLWTMAIQAMIEVTP
jgi:hypothetical protein